MFLHFIGFLFSTPSLLRLLIYRVRISSWISNWIFELHFELDFQVGFLSWIFGQDCLRLR